MLHMSVNHLRSLTKSELISYWITYTTQLILHITPLEIWQFSQDAMPMIPPSSTIAFLQHLESQHLLHTLIFLCCHIPLQSPSHMSILWLLQCTRPAISKLQAQVMWRAKMITPFQQCINPSPSPSGSKWKLKLKLKHILCCIWQMLVWSRLIVVARWSSLKSCDVLSRWEMGTREPRRHHEDGGTTDARQQIDR